MVIYGVKYSKFDPLPFLKPSSSLVIKNPIQILYGNLVQTRCSVRYSEESVIYYIPWFMIWCDDVNCLEYHLPFVHVTSETSYQDGPYCERMGTD